MKVSKELLKGSLDIVVLSALEGEPLYGYEIAKQIKEKSDEVFALGEGTLYPLLHKLEKKKMLESYWKEVGGRRRKYYKITKVGKKQFAEKTSEWKVFSGAMNAIIAA